MPAAPGYILDLLAFAGDDRKPMVVSPQLIGLPEWKKAVKKWSREMEMYAQRGIEKATEMLLEETLEVTPKDTGRLRASGKTRYDRHGKEYRGMVYFDEQEAPYAIWVHEDLTKHHDPPTMAKFLQRTQYRLRGKITKTILEECSKAKP